MSNIQLLYVVNQVSSRLFSLFSFLKIKRILPQAADWIFYEEVSKQWGNNLMRHFF
jgi:hypothetical protein